MKILGTKFFGQEASVFILDTDKKNIFAINSDRISRIKKDNFDISPIIEKYPYEFKNIQQVSYPFDNFDGSDSSLETKGTSFFWLKYQKYLRFFYKPQYRKDINRPFSFFEKIKYTFYCIFNPKLIYFKIVRDIFWVFYKRNKLGKSFHFKFIDKYIKNILISYKINFDKINYLDHHLCHAYSAYFLSSFAYKSDAITFTLDEHGDNCFASLFLFHNNQPNLISKSKTKKFWKGNNSYVTSVAGLYSNFTEAMDLVRSSDEGKVEALAAYGRPDGNLLNELESLIEIKDLSYEFDLDKYKKFSDLSYLKKIRKSVGDENFCATIQSWLENVSVNLLNKAYAKFPCENLCIAGGAAANVIMNYKIFENTPFKNIFITPPMGDEGSSAGAAIITAMKAKENLEWLKKIRMPYFGTEYSKEDVLKAITKYSNIKYEDLGDKWPEKAALSISQKKVIALYHGKMEFGPRALGNRSILANPSDKLTRDKINQKIKKRPLYQPFCPSVLEEERVRLFENSFQHKYMATAFVMKKKYWKDLPSAIHIDGTARPQFLEKKDNEQYYKLLKKVKALTGFGIVINTSFNLHGRTIVNTPEDALVDFFDCKMDELYIQGYRVYK